MSLQAIPPTPTSIPGINGRSAQATLPSSASTNNSGSLTDSSVKAAPPTAEQLQSTVDEVKQVLEPVAQNLLFSIDEDTGKTIVKIVDSTTDEVIRQIPSEEFIAIAKALDSLKGLLLKQQA